MQRSRMPFKPGFVQNESEGAGQAMMAVGIY
jgi:hypothetical protein